jgi:hypothetical protein
LHHGPQQSLGDLLAGCPWRVQLLEQDGEHPGVEVGDVARASQGVAGGQPRQARQQHANQANQPCPAVPPGPSNKLHQHGTLHPDACAWTKQHGPQVPKPDASGLQADRRTFQGKWVRCDGEETKRRLEHVERRGAGTAHGGSSIRAGDTAAIEADATH